MKNATLAFLITLMVLAAPTWAQNRPFPPTSGQQPYATQQQTSLGEIFQRIAAATNSGRRYQLGVQQSQEINAYATPDGQVVFYSGLLEALPDADALAFVMAHEISHIELGHSTKSQVAEGVLGTVLGMLVGRQSPLVQTGAALAYNAMTSGYSRSMESEADIAAMELMDRAGYNTMGAITTLQLFAQMERGGRGGGLFSTHPGAQDRLKDVTAWMQKNHAPMASDKVVAVPRPWPIVSQVITTGRQLAQRVRALPVQAGDQVARQALEQANQALAAYEQRPADPASLADLREGLTGAQSFALLSRSLATDPGLARDIEAWGQQAAQAERNQSLDQAARTRQFAVYMQQHLTKVSGRQPVDPQALASLSRLAQAAAEYENALKSNAPAAATQGALSTLLRQSEDWDRQRAGLDPRAYGNLLTGLNSELLALSVYEGRPVGADASALRR